MTFCAGGVIGAAIPGAVVVTTRGGDFDLHIGQDVSIGYLSHTDKTVGLYLQETLTFLMLTSEAAVAAGTADEELRRKIPRLGIGSAWVPPPPTSQNTCFV